MSRTPAARTSPDRGSIRWSMLLSHHPPSDLDRTFRVGGIHICTRCFGVLLGAATFATLQIRACNLASIIPAWLSMLLPLVAVADFAAHELGWWPSNNGKRLISGALLGTTVGSGVFSLLMGLTLLGVSLLAWLAALAFGVAFALRIAGRLQRYVERYESGVREERRDMPRDDSCT